ncbi:MAG: hypothetical protein FJX11_08770 [Alphaproteobacteria bacterium]|nr:hypothetical protein [Alphaproteobacteria bacterium]
MRSIGAGVATALLALILPFATSAQNGLERFEAELKPRFELKQFTCASGTPLGNSGFVLNDVVATIPANPATGDKESTIKIQKATIEALDFDRLKKDAKTDEAPRFAKLKLDGVTGNDEIFTALQPFGVPNVPFDIALDYRLDPAAKVLDLEILEVALRGQAKIALSLVVDNVSDKISEVAGTKDDGRLRTAALTLDDTGLLAKLLSAWAKEEGVTPEELVQTALAGLAAFAAQQSPPTLKALDAVASFLVDWKAPKGPLVLAVKPAKTAGLSDLDKIMVPDALTEEFGFDATYPGTRPGTAKTGASGRK